MIGNGSLEVSMLLPYAVALSARADCTFSASAEDLAIAVQAAEEAYTTLDEELFQRATIEVDFVVPCLDTPVSPELAIQLHRLRGLGSFAAGDTDSATDALEAARALAPDYVFPEEILPIGFELRDRYEAMPTEPGEARRMPRPRHGALWLDGDPARMRPTDHATLFQQVDDAGQVVQTRYLSPDDPLPHYPGVQKRRTSWLVASGLAALASGTLYGLSWSSRSGLQQVDASWTEAQLTQLQRRTNGLFWLSAASGGLAVGGTVFALRIEP